MDKNTKPRRMGRPRGIATITVLAGFGTLFGAWGGLAIVSQRPAITLSGGSPTLGTNIGSASGEQAGTGLERLSAATLTPAPADGRGSRATSTTVPTGAPRPPKKATTRSS